MLQYTNGIVAILNFNTQLLFVNTCGVGFPRYWQTDQQVPHHPLSNADASLLTGVAAINDQFRAGNKGELV